MSLPFRILIAVWLIAAGVAGSPSLCASADAVALRGSVELSRATLKLGDLFASVPAETDCDIAQAPPPGKSAVYDANLLAKLATKYHLDWKPRSNTDHVTVSSDVARITSDAIREAIIQKVKDTGARGEIDVSFDSRTAPEIDLPADQSTSFELTNFDYDALSKRFRTLLSAESGQGPVAVPITGHIAIKHRVPVLAHRLESGTIVGNADIDWLSVPEERLNESVLTDAGEIIGRELRRTTMENEVLHSNDVLSPRLVKRGSLVTMKIETSFMMLAAQGKALQDGAQGETVRVINTQSNRMLEGTVDGPDTVTIRTTQKLAQAQPGTQTAVPQ